MESIFTPKGILQYIEGYPKTVVRRLRMAVVTIPQLPAVHLKDSLDQTRVSQAKKASYADADQHLKTQAFMRLRDEGLVSSSDGPNVSKFKLHDFKKRFRRLMAAGLELQLTYLTDLDTYLVVGIDHQPDLVYRTDDPIEVDFDPSFLDAYRNVEGLESIVAFDKTAQPYIMALKSHPQGIAIDHKYVRIIDNELKADAIYSSSIPTILEPSDNPSFWINEQGYRLQEATHQFVLGSDTSFAHYINQLEGTKVIFGTRCPVGYTEIPINYFRLDLNDILEYDEGHTLLQIFEYLLEEEGFSTAYLKVHEQFMKSVNEYASRYQNFSTLMAGFQDALVDKWMVEAAEEIQVAMNGLSSLSIQDCFDPPDTDLLSNLPERCFIRLHSDLPSMAIFILCFLMRCDLDAIQLDTMIIDHAQLSELLLRQKMQMFMTRDDFPFFSYTVIHRVYQPKFTMKAYPILVLDQLGQRVMHDMRKRTALNKTTRSPIPNVREEEPLFVYPYILYNQYTIPMIPKSHNYQLLADMLMQPSFDLEKYTPMQDESVEEVPETGDTPNEAQAVHTDMYSDTEVETYVDTEEDTEAEEDLPEVPVTDEQELTTALETNDIPPSTDVVSEPTISNPDTEKVTHTETSVQYRNTTETHTEIQDSIPEPIMGTSIEEPQVDEPLSVNHHLDYLDAETHMDRIRSSTTVIAVDHMFDMMQDIISMETLLLRLRDGQVPVPSDTNSTDKLIERRLVEIIVTPEGKQLAITEKGRNKLKDRTAELSQLATDFGDRHVLEERLGRYSETMETARNRGELSYFVALFNWAQLLSVCYFNRYSHYDTISATYSRVIRICLDKGEFFEPKKMDEALSLVIDRYLAHFHQLEQDIMAPYPEIGEVTPVPKPNEDITVPEPETTAEKTKRDLKLLYKQLKTTVSQERKDKDARVVKKLGSLRKKRSFNLHIPRKRDAPYPMEEFYNLSVQHLKLPKKVRTFLKVVDKTMTIGQFMASTIDWSQLELSSQSTNATMDIRDILHSKLGKDDIVYLVDDAAVQEMVNLGLRLGYYQDEVLVQVPRSHFGRYLGKGSPKEIITPVLDYLLQDSEGSIDQKLQALKSQIRILTDEGSDGVDLSYTLKFQETYDISTDKAQVTKEFRDRLLQDLDCILLPQERLRNTHQDDHSLNTIVE